MNEIESYEWSYLTEGGKHVVFSCANHPAWLLRLDKSDLVRRSQQTCLKSDCTELFLIHYLAPYVTLPIRVQLLPSFAEQLVQGALGCGRIPKSRNKDWSSINTNDETKGNGHERIVGQIVKDARMWHFGNHQENRKNQPPLLSVEIKPKAGYRCCSPFVDPQRRIKFQYPRFRLVQQARGSFSNYNPLDLFSGEFDRIEHAIRELIQCPQNNFKVWKGNESCDTKDDTFLSNSIPIMIAHVLLKEPCLTKLSAMQKLDLLDADGAILLYEHLVDSCQGQEKVVMELIDSSWDMARDRCVIPASPIHLARPSLALRLLCEKIQLFSHELDKVWPDVPSSTYLDEQRKKALDLLHQLDPDDSVFLLQNWLLSLCLCDVSIFVTFSGNHDDCLNISPNSCHVDRLQEDDVPGLLTVHSADTSDAEHDTIQLEYCVHVIDFDQKPASKLRTRQWKEMALNGLKLK